MSSSRILTRGVDIQHPGSLQVGHTRGAATTAGVLSGARILKANIHMWYM